MTWRYRLSRFQCNILTWRCEGSESWNLGILESRNSLEFHCFSWDFYRIPLIVNWIPMIFLWFSMKIVVSIFQQQELKLSTLRALWVTDHNDIINFDFSSDLNSKSHKLYSVMNSNFLEDFAILMRFNGWNSLKLT